jgi:hypothetical protein
VKFPDAGGAHLTTKAKGGKIVVRDAVALEDWIRVAEPRSAEIPYKPAGSRHVPPTIDVVAKTMKVHAHPSGRLVSMRRPRSSRSPASPSSRSRRRWRCGSA